MERQELLYEGKAKKVFATLDPNLVIIHYKDSATAFNRQKEGVVKDKGVLNNEIVSLIYAVLHKQGIKTHFVKKLSERDQLCQKVKIIPLEVIVRNLIAGSMAKRLNVVEGTKPDNVIFEICYKDDSLGDPLINDHHAIALKFATATQLTILYQMSGQINTILQQLFMACDLILVDFKLEFGINAQGEIVLADEISPDTCRLWDKTTLKKLDKDRFRLDLGQVEEAYIEILRRLKENLHG